MQIYRLAPEDLIFYGRLMWEYPPTLRDKYLLFDTGESLPWVLLAPIQIIYTNDAAASIYHETMKKAMEHKRYWRDCCLDKIMGGGRVRCCDNTLQIYDYSRAYGRAPQEILDKIKEAVLEFYQNLFPDFKMNSVIAEGGKK